MGATAHPGMQAETLRFSAQGHRSLGCGATARVFGKMGAYRFHSMDPLRAQPLGDE